MRGKTSPNGSSDALVSVIIPTKNSAKTVEKCIRSIVAQTHKNTEILVMDALSTDKTLLISKELGAKIVSVDGERMKAKNIGTMSSSGEYVFFVDSDMELEPKVIEECLDACHDDGVAAVVIPERSVGKGFWVRVRDFERSFYAGSAIESARFFKKKYVNMVGGFDERFVYYEESTLHQKIEELGMKVNARTSACILHNEEGFNLRRWLGKKKYYANSLKEYSGKYTEYANMQASIAYRMSVFTSNGKWKRLCKNPVLAVGLFVLKGLELLYSKI